MRRWCSANVPVFVGLLAFVLGACVPSRASPVPTAQPTGAPAPPFTLLSPAFENGATIPARYTCEGENLSPELGWEGAPAKTRSFALIVDDPDAPGGTFTHWVLFDIPADLSSLPEGVRPGEVGVSGRNDFGRVGYGGPCPPPGDGPHRYFFTLYALDVESLGLSEGASRDQVEQALKDHVVGKAQLMGRYERK